MMGKVKDGKPHLGEVGVKKTTIYEKKRKKTFSGKVVVNIWDDSVRKVAPVLSKGRSTTDYFQSILRNFQYLFLQLIWQDDLAEFKYHGSFDSKS